MGRVHNQREIRAPFASLGLDSAPLPAERLVRPSRMTTGDRTFLPFGVERLREGQRRLAVSEQHRILDWAHRWGVCAHNEQVLPAGFREQVGSKNT